MRGKPGLKRSHQWGRRNIPAYAGKTSGWDNGYCPGEEHPRVCGENGHEEGPSLP